MLALVLGLVVSAGLYFAYLWPSVEPLEEELAVAPAAPALDGGAAEPAPADPAPAAPAPADPAPADPAPAPALASAPDPSADVAPAPAAAP